MLIKNNSSPPPLHSHDLCWWSWQSGPPGWWSYNRQHSSHSCWNFSIQTLDKYPGHSSWQWEGEQEPRLTSCPQLMLQSPHYNDNISHWSPPATGCLCLTKTLTGDVSFLHSRSVATGEHRAALSSQLTTASQHWLHCSTLTVVLSPLHRQALHNRSVFSQRRKEKNRIFSKTFSALIGIILGIFLAICKTETDRWGHTFSDSRPC